MTNPFRMENQKTKVCTKCASMKTLSSFSNLNGASDGRESICRTCFNLEAQDNDSHELIALRRKRKRHENWLMDKELQKEISEVWAI